MQSDILYDSDEEEDTFTEDDKAKADEVFLDMERSKEVRQQSLCYLTQPLEVIHKCVSLYTLTNVHSYLENIQSICECIQFEDAIRIECAIHLAHLGQEKALCELLPTLDDSILKYKGIQTLMKFEQHSEKCYCLFKTFIQSRNITEHIRFKTILEAPYDYTCTFLPVFFKDDQNSFTIRILCCQYAFRGIISPIDLSVVETFQTKIEYDEQRLEALRAEASAQLIECSGEQYPHRIRADAADILLSLGNEREREIGRNIILELGAVGGVVRNIYEDAENVHTESIQTDLNHIITSLKDIPFSHTFEQIKTYIYNEMWKKQHQHYYTDEYDMYQPICVKEIPNEIELAFIRIEMDAVHYIHSFTLKKILCMVWTYIQSKTVEEGRQALIEILCDVCIEMSDKCSSGYATRLVNVMSGFGDFSIQISEKERFIGIITHQLNKCIQEDEQCEQLLIEMTNEFSNREYYNAFIIKIIPVLCEQYKDEMDANICISEVMKKFL